MLIEARGLVKNYGSAEVIKNIDFSLDTGEILGLLGPNGAGKTTIMRMLSGYFMPDSGVIKICGNAIDETSVLSKNQIGYLPENVPLYNDMTVFGYLRFITEARLIPKTERLSKIENVISQCGLNGRGNQKIETLSRGYKQRLGLAQAVIHNPPILLLDEPLTGLDPIQINQFRKLIKELGKDKGVIFSTHILQEAEYVCTRYIILDEGKIAAQGPIEYCENDNTGNRDGSARTNLEEIFSSLEKGNRIDQA